MLKPCRKKLQNSDMKKDGKISAQEQLNWNQHDLYIVHKACMGIGW